MDAGSHGFSVYLYDTYSVTPNYYDIDFVVRYLEIDKEKVFNIDVGKLRSQLRQAIVPKSFGRRDQLGNQISFVSLDIVCTKESNSTVARTLCADIKDSLIQSSITLRRDLIIDQGATLNERVDDFKDADSAVFDLDIHNITNHMKSKDYAITPHWVLEALNSSYLEITLAVNITYELY